jgi:hypothetical protein
MISPQTTCVEGLMIQSDLAFCLVTGILLMLLVVLSRWLCRGGKIAPAATKTPSAKRDPKPFAGLTQKPDCPACEQEAGFHLSAAPSVPPPCMIFTRGRHRHVETTGHCCPQTSCAYHGRVGLGNIRANGHPNGRRWRQLVCLGCHGYCLETVGMPLPGKQMEPDTLVWAIAALTEGRGIRAVARVFAVAPNTVLRGLGEAAEPLEGFARSLLHDMDVEQVQMDALFA